MIVAIDGPAGAGKSTVARQLSSRLGFRYLDTGAMYRALTWLALDEAISLEDGLALAALAQTNAVTFDAGGGVAIGGRDIGTVVAPDAEVKVYLVAEPGVRARRRLSERPEIGADALATDLRLRDQRDAVRMQPAPDATTIDTTDLNIDDVVAQIEALVRARTAA